MPKKHEQFRIDGAMTALHWASIHGTSALPVAQKAIRAALAHQPSYINGLDLIQRFYRIHEHDHHRSRLFIADHPPPMFLAVTHGILELCQALIYAGADVSLLLGRSVRFEDCRDWDRNNPGKFIRSKIHQKCPPPWRGGGDRIAFLSFR